MRFPAAAAFWFFAAASPHAQQCPAILSGATKLAVAISSSMETAKTSLYMFERKSPEGSWSRRLGPVEAVAGAKGFAWGHPYRSLAKAGEPLKTEGDKRTPLGIYRLDSAFGFEARPLSSYIKLERDTHYCVDDVRSPHYGRIVSKARAGDGVSGENMREIALYRRGIIIGYPPERGLKAGSCIFLHVWKGSGNGTGGCLAAPEEVVAAFQAWAGSGSAIAILSRDTFGRFKSCLPGVAP